MQKRNYQIYILCYNSHSNRVFSLFYVGARTEDEDEGGVTAVVCLTAQYSVHGHLLLWVSVCWSPAPKCRYMDRWQLHSKYKRRISQFIRSHACSATRQRSGESFFHSAIIARKRREVKSFTRINSSFYSVSDH